MDTQLSSTVSTDGTFEELARTGETLAEDLRARILAFGNEAVTPLLALLADDAAAAEDAPGEGWPPIHAVDLLADLRAEAAIARMLVALRGGDMDGLPASCPMSFSITSSTCSRFYPHQRMCSARRLR